MIRRLGLLMILPIFLVGSLLMSQSTVKNPHGKLKWDCQDCHTTDSWNTMRSDLKFEHASTGFQLVGAHNAATCIGCHKDPVFSHVSTSCIDCHTDQHQGQLGTDCLKCHNTRNWSSQQNTFELHAARGFALVGAHTVADCESCHSGQSKQEFVGTATDCVSCHQQDFNATVEPAHAQLGFSTQCQNCHSPSHATWTGADFSHPASFPLNGGHRGVACQSCHPSGYTNTPTDCYSCHQPDFLSTSAPAHVSNGFPHDCLQCHTIMAWQPANYDHNATAFPLTGAHTQTACISCHSTQFAGTPTACIACHQTDFNQTSNPRHQLAGFDQNCLTCHTTTAWQPSSFNHASTGFTLTGQHIAASCSSCHSTQFAGTPSNCVSCHQSDFNGTSNPNHLAAAFPTTCQTCHTTSGWTPSTWDHDAQYFPINTGAHSNVACIQCHTVANTFASFSCIDCHTHSKTTTDNHHSQVNNYQYLSSACYSCHPRGRS